MLVVAALAVALVRSGPSGKTAEKAAEVLTTPLPEPAEPAKPIVLAPRCPGQVPTRRPSGSICSHPGLHPNIKEERTLAWY